MDKCICPEDGREVPSDRRVFILEPGAEQNAGPVKVKDATKMHIFDKDCPVHGYKDVTEYE